MQYVNPGPRLVVTTEVIIVAVVVVADVVVIVVSVVSIFVGVFVVALVVVATPYRKSSSVFESRVVKECQELGGGRKRRDSLLRYMASGA